MLSKQQIKWASQHDWFVSQQVDPQGNGSVVVEDVMYNWIKDTSIVTNKTFSDIEELKAWAGY